MSEKKKHFGSIFNTTWGGFYLLVVFLFCLKTYIAYQTKFTLGTKGSLQEFILAINAIPAALLTFGIALYFNGKLKYWLLMIVDFIESTWIFANIVYYREFSDFLSMGIIKGSGNVQNNLGKSLMEILHASDFFVYIDIVILIILLIARVIKVDHRHLRNGRLSQFL